MAALELILSQARRHCFKPSCELYILFRSPSPLPHSTPTFPLHGFHRSLCSSSSSPEPNPQPEDRPNELTRRPEPISIQAVSYPTKPKDPSPYPPEEGPPQSIPPIRQTREPTIDPENRVNTEVRSWTREDIRYVKDVPKISPVSYPSRVAPLPEDRMTAASSGGEAEEEVEEGAKVEEKKVDADVGLARERQRIQADYRRVRWGLRVEEEKVPFPTLIKQEQKNKKVIYDLQEAIRLVK
ncbi:hypothetical protein U1Q18_024731, partial [Sarracenia purpurea var. burkii]